jgi:hypothetical protein
MTEVGLTRLNVQRGVTLRRVHGELWEGTGDRVASDVREIPSAAALVGEAARDYRRIDALLSANFVVILIPSLQAGRAILLVDEANKSQPGAAGKDAGLCVDLIRHRVLWEGRELRVSEHEFAMLATLSKTPGRACTFEELAEPGGATWLGDTERVHSAIKRLRRKFAAAGVEVSIESIRGYGYRLAEPSARGRTVLVATSTRMVDSLR